MPVPDHHIAQLNVGRLRAERDDPMIGDFMAALEPINALADASPGFVWRLASDEGNATALHPYGDERIIVNMSVWSSIEALEAYVYRTAHTEVLRRRREWFDRWAGSYMVLWWVPVGYVPSVDEARSRLDLLERIGPSPAAFTFRQRFAAPLGATPPLTGVR